MEEDAIPGWATGPEESHPGRGGAKSSGVTGTRTLSIDGFHTAPVMERKER